MHRSAFVFAALFSSLALANSSEPMFSKGAVMFGVEYGAGFWNIDEPRLAAQVDDADAQIFTSDMKNSHTATLRLGYNILGHATIEAALTGTGWNIFDANRGGAGFLVGLLHWHPLELIWHGKERPVPFDFSVFGGLGYGIAGQNRGEDGMCMEVGGDAAYFFAKAVGIGIFARDVLMNFDKFYFDFDNKVFVKLPQGSGGSHLSLGIELQFRFETD